MNPHPNWLQYNKNPDFCQGFLKLRLDFFRLAFQFLQFFFASLGKVTYRVQLRGDSVGFALVYTYLVIGSSRGKERVHRERELVGEEFLEELESLVFEFQFVLVVRVERVYRSGIDNRDRFLDWLVSGVQGIVGKPSNRYRQSDEDDQKD